LSSEPHPALREITSEQWNEYSKKLLAYTTRHFNQYGGSEVILPGGYSAADVAQEIVVRVLNKTDLLILDDWLRDPPTLPEAQSLLDILDDRYSQSSVLLVTQFPIDTWHARIPDPTLSDAILDRLIHNAHRIELQGHSQRKIRAEQIMSAT